MCLNKIQLRRRKFFQKSATQTLNHQTFSVLKADMCIGLCYISFKYTSFANINFNCQHTFLYVTLNLHLFWNMMHKYYSFGTNPLPAIYHAMHQPTRRHMPDFRDP